MIRIEPTNRLRGTVQVPGDKSISHRALLFGALAEGRTTVIGLSGGEDVRSTRRCLEAMGVKVQDDGDRVHVEGVGLHGLRDPKAPLDCGNSGTTMRSLMGVLAAQNFETVLVGDESLSNRPMKRVAEPLRRMGARIEMREGTFAPIRISGSRLSPIEYELPVASAQVKTAVLLAGLYADGKTTVGGRTDSRDHTERGFKHFGVGVAREGVNLSVTGGQPLKAKSIIVPGDTSSAAFWLAAGALVSGAKVTVPNVLLNPTRTGFLRALDAMGAKISIDCTGESPEPVGDVTIEGGAPLKAIYVEESDVPSLIDEIPMLAVLAAYAEGTTTIRGAEELRVKETDRIEAVATNLRRLGVEVETYPDGLAVTGPRLLSGGAIDSFGDHRIAMAFAVGALGATGPIEIEGEGAVAISYPSFFATLEGLRHG